MKSQDDVKVLYDCIVIFNKLSSAKVNWRKSEALALSDRLSRKLVLSEGLFCPKTGTV